MGRRSYVWRSLTGYAQEGSSFRVQVCGVMAMLSITQETRLSFLDLASMMVLISWALAKLISCHMAGLHSDVPQCLKIHCRTHFL